MNEPPDQRPLLDDVLAESSPPDFRAALLDETLRLARQRRRGRQARRAGGVLAALFLAAWFSWQNRPAKTAVRPSQEISALKSYQLVTTQPLPAGALVATKDFAGIKMISSSAAVTAVATRGGGFQFINDAQLLALAGSRPALLIRTGPNSEDLVFADSATPTAAQKNGGPN